MSAAPLIPRAPDHTPLVQAMTDAWLKDLNRGGGRNPSAVIATCAEAAIRFYESAEGPEQGVML